MSDYWDIVPFINSPSLVQHSQQSQGFNYYGYENPSEESQSDLRIENDGVEDNLHHSRQGEVPEPPPSRAGTSRTGDGDVDQRSLHPLTPGGCASMKSEESRTLTPHDDPFVGEKEAWTS